MTELHMLWAWLNARVGKLRDTSDDNGNNGADAGFSTLEWVALAGVIIVAAVVVATILMNKAKTGANKINVQ